MCVYIYIYINICTYAYIGMHIHVLRELRGEGVSAYFQV